MKKAIKTLLTTAALALGLATASDDVGFARGGGMVAAFAAM